jgi:hypothetical protein
MLLLSISKILGAIFFLLPVFPRSILKAPVHGLHVLIMLRGGLLASRESCRWVIVRDH